MPAAAFLFAVAYATWIGNSLSLIPLVSRFQGAVACLGKPLPVAAKPCGVPASTWPPEGGWPAAAWPAPAIPAVVVLMTIFCFCLAAGLSLRWPRRYFHIATGLSLVLGLFCLVLANLRWNRWFASDSQLRDWSQGWFNALMAGTFALTTGPLWLLGRRRERAGRSNVSR